MKTNLTKLLDTDDVIDALASAIAVVGTQSKWCAEHDISPAYVSDVLNRRREPGKKILDALGYEAVMRYRAKN